MTVSDLEARKFWKEWFLKPQKELLEKVPYHPLPKELQLSEPRKESLCFSEALAKQLGVVKTKIEKVVSVLGIFKNQD